MDIVNFLVTYPLPFVIALGVLVFVHELGHYLVARWCGVKVDVFSIGFGPEIFGWNDRQGTRWRVAIVPLGGYVKMYGDANAASTPGDGLDTMSAAERAVSFHHKTLGQRAAIILAGPAANFLFAIVAFIFLFVARGQPFTPPQIGSVVPGGPAAVAGLVSGDVVTAIDGWRVDRFEDLQAQVRAKPGQTVELDVLRDGRTVTLQATLRLREDTDRFGNVHRVGQLGVTGGGAEYRELGPVDATVQAVRETWNLSVGTLGAIGQMIMGTRGTEEIGGPIRIAQMSGQVAQLGVVAFVWFLAVLSINLGLINLFPIPLLDGGHLMFYAIEAVRGRPLGERAQEYGLRIGLALVLTLLVFATWNDIGQIRW
jgi:regulator of sigma E protease